MLSDKELDKKVARLNAFATKPLQTYKYKEEFTVTFEIEADTKAKADKAYSDLFDKNIQLGYDKWKDVDKKIKVGSFHVSVSSGEGEEE